jgi:hypothetical protein
LTEELTGGTTPETEATASVDDQASEQAVGIATADEPAETTTATTFEATEPPAPTDPEAVQAPEASEVPAGEVPAGEVPAGEATPAVDVPQAVEAPVACGRGARARRAAGAGRSAP